MARFIECRTSQGVVYQVNVDQITYLQRGARDEYTRIHFVGLISRLASKRPHNKLWGRLTKYCVSEVRIISAHQSTSS